MCTTPHSCERSTRPPAWLPLGIVRQARSATLAVLVMVVLAACGGGTVPNDSIVADAGGDQTVAVGSEVTLDASASSGPDGASLEVRWPSTACRRTAPPTSTIQKPP